MRREDESAFLWGESTLRQVLPTFPATQYVISIYLFGKLNTTVSAVTPSTPALVFSYKTPFVVAIDLHFDVGIFNVGAKYLFYECH